MTDSEMPEARRPAGSPADSPDVGAHVPAWAIPAGAEHSYGSASSASSASSAQPPAEPVIDQDTTRMLRAVIEPVDGPRPKTPLRRRRGLLALAGTGAAFVLAGAGFVAGAGLHRGDTDTTTLISGSVQDAPNGLEGRSGDGSGGGGAASGLQSGGRGGGRAISSATFTAGQITAISGSTLTLNTFRGASVKVTTTAKTTVAGAAGGDLTSLQVGQLIFVAGTRQTDGSYAATAITDRPGVDPDGDQAGQAGQAGQGSQPGQSGQSGQFGRSGESGTTT